MLSLSLLLVLVAFIPTSKAWHMLAGWYSLAVKPERLGEFPNLVWLRDPQAVATWPVVDEMG